MVSFLIQKFQRNFEINTNWIKILISLEDHENFDNKREVNSFSRILNSQHIWNSKLNNQESESELNDNLPLEYLQKLNQLNHQETINFIDQNLRQLQDFNEDQHFMIDVLFQSLQDQAFYRGRFYEISIFRYLFDKEMIAV